MNLAPTMATGATAALYWAALVLTLAALGIGVAAGALDRHGWVRTRLGQHAAALDLDLRFLRAAMTGSQLALLQMVLAAGGLLGAIATGEVLFAVLAPAALVLPGILLRRARTRRVARIEAQLDGWLVALANALESAPSLGHALPSSAEVAGGPLAEEIDVALKQMMLGTPVDAALLEIARRAESRPVAGGIAALLVARQTGGDLPAILRRTAASLREMTRLEGVLRAKTSDARNQAYVLLMIPFAIVFAIHQLDPAWLEPLGASALGWIVTGLAAALWLAAVVSARFILAVDL